MRKVIQSRLGSPEVLETVEAEIPVPGPTEVLVEVKAAGVNPVDWKVRNGGGLGDPPFSVGWDVSGVVTEVGPGVTRFKPGDEVFGMPRFPLEAAVYADYVTAPSRHLALKPSAMSHVQAAGLSLAGLTGWQALVATAGLEAASGCSFRQQPEGGTPCRSDRQESRCLRHRNSERRKAQLRQGTWSGRGHRLSER